MRDGIKRLLFSLLGHGRIPELALALQRSGSFIVLYHGVAPELSNYGIYNYRKKNILPESFEKHLAWFRSRFEIVPLSTLIERFLKGVKLPRRSIAVTFDDGYENIYRHAVPILKKFGAPAAIFITTDLVEKRLPLWVDRLEYALGHTPLQLLEVELEGDNHSFQLNTPKERMDADAYIRNRLKKISDSERLNALETIETRCKTALAPVIETSPYRGLTWDQIRTMAEDGIEFAPHTASHPILTRMPPQEAEEEIIESCRLLEKRVGGALPVFAYPNGETADFSDEIVAILRRHGFRAALTTVPGTLRRATNPFAIPRFSMDGSDDMRFFRLTVSGVRKNLQDIRSVL